MYTSHLPLKHFSFTAFDTSVLKTVKAHQRVGRRRCGIKEHNNSLLLKAITIVTFYMYYMSILTSVCATTLLQFMTLFDYILLNIKAVVPGNYYF